jgi:hypothetical protein
MRSACKSLVGKPEGKRQLGRLRHRWEDNIKIGRKKVGWEGVDWIRLAQDKGPVAVCCEHDNEPSGSIKGG